MQSLGKIVLRAPAVCAKIWCLSLFVFLSRSEVGRRRAVRSRGALLCRLLPDLDAVFSLFLQVIAVSDALLSSHICR